MICSPCLTVCRVPLCTEQIILGSISSISTDVKIIIENKTKGGKRIVSTQSDGSGVVTLVTEGLGFMPDQTYNISVVLNTATALCDTETITIGSSTASCVSVIFENIKDAEGCQVEFESQTLVVVDENNNPVLSHCCDPITHTVAEMQALVGSFEPNAWYIITDPQSSFGVLRIRARDENNLERGGELIKDNISFPVEYSLSDDLIMSIHDVRYNNRFNISLDSFGTIITNFPYNNANYHNNSGQDVTFTLNNVASSSVARNVFGAECVIGINVAGVTITDCIFGQVCGVQIDTMAAALQGCTIGFQISLVLSQGEAYTGKIINQKESTFNKTRDITGGGVYNFSNAGYDEGFAGIIDLTSSNASESITSFIGNNYSHEREYRGQAGKAFTFVHNGTDIICKGAANAVLSGANDYVKFRYVGNVAIEIERGNY